MEDEEEVMTSQRYRHTIRIIRKRSRETASSGPVPRRRRGVHGGRRRHAGALLRALCPFHGMKRVEEPDHVHDAGLDDGRRKRCLDPSDSRTAQNSGIA